MIPDRRCRDLGGGRLELGLTQPSEPVQIARLARWPFGKEVRSAPLRGGFQSTSQQGRWSEECSHPVSGAVPAEDLPIADGSAEDPAAMAKLGLETLHYSFPRWHA
jgi:hypothetical protein